MTSLSLLKASAALIALPLAATAFAQDFSAPPETYAAAAQDDVYLGDDEIVVTGQRLPGQVVGDIPPEDVLDPRDIRATGATDVTEILDAIAPQIGSARGRGGERPVLLLNGQRISSFRELHDIPSEAIARVEILPEEVALKYGYRADQRVVNFVLRPRFRSTVAQVEGGAATDGGYGRGEVDLDRLLIGEEGRTTISLDAEANGALKESERDIRFDPDVSARDERQFRTLVGSGHEVRAAATVNRQLFETISATVNGELEHREGKSLFGLSDTLADPLVRNTRSDSAHLGAVLNGMTRGWRWSAISNADLAWATTRSDRSDDGRPDYARLRTVSADLALTANGRLFALPAGAAGLTLNAGAAILDLDSRRVVTDTRIDSSLSRTQASFGGNLDLPVSRRDSDFTALGALTVNLNGEIKQLSDFGALLTVGAGANWSPADRVNLIASWTREQGAPSVQQLGEPILETPDTRIFDFTRGETALVTAVTGGNPGLSADRRNVFKLGANWHVLKEPDLRLRGEYVRSVLDDPVANFPGPSAVLEAAFPERFIRNSSGELVFADLRPVNYDGARKDSIRWGMDFSKPLKSAAPSPEAIARMRERRARHGGPAQPAAQAPGEGPGVAPGERPPSAARSPGRGGGGFGRFGNRQGGRLHLSFTHTATLTDTVSIRPGLADLDYLDGDALNQFGGRPRHEVEGRAGWSNNGLGAFLSANWRSGTNVDRDDGSSLRFSPLATFDLRLFANLGERFDLVSKAQWLRGSSVRLQASNIFNARPRVRDSLGEVPANYQSDLLDPLGRTMTVSFRKLFLPSRRPRQPQAGQAPD